MSVVIPCFNYARYLSDAVGSALAQEGVDVDVVVVDDKSTDESVSVALSFAERDPRVRLVQHAQNQGHVETSNEALSLATGEFIVKLDADDILTPGSLARSAELLVAHPDVGFCYGYPLAFEGDPPTDFSLRLRGWTVWEGSEWIARVLRRGRSVILQPEVMLRRDAVVATGGYRPQLRWGEDLNWWLRLATIGSVGHVNGATQGLYRMHDKSFQRSAANVALGELNARVAAIELFFAECEGAVANPEVLRRLALRALAVDARRLAADAAHTSGEHAAAPFREIAAMLDARAGVSTSRAFLVGSGPQHRLARKLDERVGWRLWRRYGTRVPPWRVPGYEGLR